MLNGSTGILAHVGYPTATFKSPLIYNPWFARQGINAAVVPFGVKREDFAAAFPAIARLANLRGMLITMPHKIAVVGLLDEVSTAGQNRRRVQRGAPRRRRPLARRHVRRRGFCARRCAQGRVACGQAGA